MTSKETIQQTKEDIDILQEKLKKLEELENQKSKSPVEEAFKKVFGYYPDGCQKSFWVAFQKGYNEGFNEGTYQESYHNSIQ